MVLHSESEGIVAQSYLLDDVIGCAPRLHFEPGAEFIDRLMMRTIHFFKTMTRPAIGPQRLDVVRLLTRQVVAGDVEMKGTAERDIENLQSFADRENRKPAFDRMFDGVEFPAVAIRFASFSITDGSGTGWFNNSGATSAPPVSNNPFICSNGTLR